MSFTELKTKLSQFDKDLDRTYTQIRELLHEKESPSARDHVYCYFSQSMLLDYEQNDSHLIMGSFFVKNMADRTMNSPIILLKIDSKTKFNFSGKYKAAKQSNQTYNFLWERLEIENLDPVNHYCLQPIQTKHLSPNAQLSFQNFQVKIPADASITIEGFAYFDGSNDGIPALNTINVSI